MKVQVKFRTGLAGERFSYRRNEIRWLDAQEAADLIAVGFAEPVADEEAVRAELADLKAQLAGEGDPAADALADELAQATAALTAAMA